MGHYVKDGAGRYRLNGSVSADDIMRFARRLAEERLQRGAVISSPDKAEAAIQTLIADKEHEVFYALFLDSKHRVISHCELFRGTIDSASVPLREVVKESLACNAAAVIFAHNHPSGVCEPSASDRKLTGALQEACALVGVRVIDHFVCGVSKVYSFAEAGLL